MQIHGQQDESMKYLSYDMVLFDPDVEVVQNVSIFCLFHAVIL